MELLTPITKGLLTKILNFNELNNHKFLISTENFILIIPSENPSMLKSYKKVNESGEWEFRECDVNMGLKYFNLFFKEEDITEEEDITSETVESSECDEDVDVAEIKSILYKLFLIFLIKTKIIKCYFYFVRRISETHIN